MAHFAQPVGNDLLARTGSYYHWQSARRQLGVWPYARSLDGAPLTHCSIRDAEGSRGAGINFASQDYLSLSSHPAIIEAAQRTAGVFGVHSAGSACLLGNTRLSLELEEAIAQLVQLPEVVLFPTGWGAGFGIVKALVRPDDHIVMDVLSHACLQEGARAATGHVTRHRHLDLGDLEEKLSAIRHNDARNGIMVITEGLFSMDSDVPDLRATQELAHRYGATLLVDVAHDLGALGPQGGGSIGAQGMVGKIDLVMGSFSKTFASNGGFVACASPAVKEYIKYYGGPHTFSNALSPIQAAVVRECIGVVQSQEGDTLRADLMRNSVSLREAFRAKGPTCMGVPSAIVPVPVGNEKVARIASRILSEQGVFANLVEFPAVGVGAARFRLQVMAKHTTDQAVQAANAVADAVDEARAWFRAEGSCTTSDPIEKAA